MKKKILITLIVVCTMLFALGMMNASAETVASGTCGYNVNWVLDDNGTLTISGSGSMNNYTYDSNSPWYSTKENIISVAIQNGVTSIGDYAFFDCSSLTSIEIPDSVTSIGQREFWGCSSLVSIEIPDSVTSIGDAAFSRCSSLVSITIPDSVTSIDDWAFSYCSSLASIEIPDSVTSIGNWAFSYCSSLANIEIPDSVTSIGDDVFYYCTSLESITIPDGITSIGYDMFSGCSKLESITIPDSVTSIENSSFRGCSSLVSITIGNGITSIDDYAFYYCTSLESITIPDSVKSIGYMAFYYCSSLAHVYYIGSEEDWDKISIDYYNEPLTNATIHFIQDIPEQYRINEITLKDMSGNSLQAIPTGTFLATVSFTNVSSSKDTVIILTQYTDTGAFKGLMYIQTEDVLIGTTDEHIFPVDNSKGDVATLKAFCWESFGFLTPMGYSASFPSK